MADWSIENLNPDMTTNGMLLNISVSSKKKEKETGYSKHLIRSSQSESRITHCADVFFMDQDKTRNLRFGPHKHHYCKISFNCPNSFSGQDISTS